MAWTAQVEDLSGLEPVSSDWLELDALQISLSKLLHEIGRVYAPALLANARALEADEPHWETLIDGVTWTQQTFAYQGKCLQWINQQFQALSESQQAEVLALLSGTGCETLLGH